MKKRAFLRKKTKNADKEPSHTPKNEGRGARDSGISPPCEPLPVVCEGGSFLLRGGFYEGGIPLLTLRAAFPNPTGEEWESRGGQKREAAARSRISSFYRKVAEATEREARTRLLPKIKAKYEAADPTHRPHRFARWNLHAEASVREEGGMYAVLRRLTLTEGGRVRLVHEEGETFSLASGLLLPPRKFQKKTASPASDEEKVHPEK